MLRPLKNLLQKTFSVGLAETSLSLPSDIVELIPNGKAYPIRGFIEWICDQSESDRKQLFSLLSSAIQNQNWVAIEIRKIHAYYAYFLRNYKDAYEQVIEYVSESNFDPDCFGIACMALYNSNQFMLAYRLLKSTRTHQNSLFENIDYLIAATMISWSAGDRYLTSKYMDLAMRLNSDNNSVRFNGLALYFELGQVEQAEKIKKLYETDPTSGASFAFSMAFVELAKNNYREGFKLAESRYSLPEAYRHMRAELLAKPRWQGEDISDKILLIHGEQGLGDTVMMSRYFPLAQRLAKKVIVDCPPESIALLKHNFPDLEYFPRDDTQPINLPFDFWVGSLSLPLMFDSVCETVPGKSGYLDTPADHVEYWIEQVNMHARPGHIKVGVAWSGFPGHRADRRRSLEWKLARLMLEQHPEVDFFVLQTKAPDDLPANVYNVSDQIATLSDTAALVGQMDLVISVDTSIVHIAGALGKQTWMLLPYRYEWRWGLEGEANCWYDSVRVLRQPSAGAWAPVLSRAFGRELKQFIKNFPGNAR